ncbi:MAG: hypothetical protein DRJ32_05035 [Thermoprotei archaeon]|nr:MAG: hypothetical protein DRJ32_05035 [Thermoprotei archaeon]
MLSKYEIELLKNRLSKALGIDLVSIVIFGSATRSDDFTSGLSEIDVAVITLRKIRVHERMNILKDFRVNAVFLTLEEFLYLLKEGFPLIYFILHDSHVLYDRGFISKHKGKFKITKKTKEYLHRAGLSNLSMAVESYFRGMYRESLNSLYRAVRHAIRHMCCERMGVIPVSNAEIVEKSRELFPDMLVSSIFVDLVRVRGFTPSRNYCREHIENVLKVFSEMYRVSYVSIDAIEEILRGKRVLKRIDAIIENEKLIWRVKLMEEDGSYREVDVG